MDLDPVFVRALRLLHSSSKDSASQLKAMLDDCLRQRQSTPTLHSSGSNSSTSTKKDPIAESKRSYDKLVKDLSDLVPTKKQRMDSPGSTKSHTPSPAPAPTSPGFFEKGSTGSRSIQSGSSSSAEDLDVDLNLDTLNDCTCFICKSFNQENGNKLMECHTCQNLYHQECHIPMVSNEEAANPRLVWNCADCSKTLKKVAAPVKPASSKAPAPTASGPSGKSARASPSKFDGPTTNPVFKRVDQKGSTSSSGSGGKPAGMAALAATFKSNLSVPTMPTKVSAPQNKTGRSGLGPSSSINPSSANSSSSSTLMTADKRLQMMKKKAAAQRKVR